MDSKHSYLSQVKFDKTLLHKGWAKYLANIRLPILLILTIFAIGINTFVNIPRRLNPEIKIPIVIVSTILPGAGSEDVESLVTVPIEDAVNDIKGIDTLTSVSRENSSTTVMQFLSTVDGEKARTDVQAAVDSVSDLPEDAITPVVQLVDFENQPFWTFSLTTKKDTASLMLFSKEFQKKIEALPKVDKVDISGLQTQEIEVVIDPVKMNEYNINPAVLSQAIKRATNTYPLGTIDSGNSSFALTINRDINSIEDIRNIRLTVSGQSDAPKGATNSNQTIHLSDIARVMEKPPTNQRNSFFASTTTKATPAIQFFVFKTSSSNIDDAYLETKKLVDETLHQYNNTFELKTIMNTADLITKQFDDLTRDFLLTIGLVAGFLLIFLGIRQALIASLTVPLALLSALTIINSMGITLNFLTMFSFLLTLGLLIDNTIMIVAAMTRYYRTGKFSPYETGLMVWRDFIVPLWSTTIATIWAFVPLLLATGIIGEFIKTIPIVVTATMLSSTTIAILITIPLMIFFLKPEFPKRVVTFFGVLIVLVAVIILALSLPKNIFLPIIILLFLAFLFMSYRIRKQLGGESKKIINNNTFLSALARKSREVFDRGFIDIEKLSEQYKVVISKILDSAAARRGVLIAIGSFALIAYLLLAFGLVKNEFFPKTDEDLIYVNVTLPPGTNTIKTTTEALALTEKLRHTEVVDYITTEVGQTIGGDGGRASDSNGFLITLHLPAADKRHVTSGDLSERLRARYKNYAPGTFAVQELSGGPPVGADLQVKFLGNDLATLDTLTNQVVAFLNKQPGATNVEKSLKPGTSRLVFTPDKNKLAEHGLTVDSIALATRTFASGFTLDTLKSGTEEQDIILKLSENTQTPEMLGSIMIPTSGEPVSLLSLGTIALETNPTSINREDSKRTISVTAGVTKGTSATELNTKLQKFIASMDLPTGYTTTTGGLNEENEKSVQSILQAMLLSFLLILITMVIEFRSFRQTFIALMIIPLSIAGVFYIFALFGIPLSFPALIGTLALFGIVVTHVIIVIEKINDNLKEGMKLKAALVDASGSRLEPVLLTSMATIVGLIPITLSDPFWRGLGGAIISGLLFSGAIKLFFVPVTFYILFKDDRDINK